MLSVRSAHYPLNVEEMDYDALSAALIDETTRDHFLEHVRFNGVKGRTQIECIQIRARIECTRCSAPAVVTCRRSTAAAGVRNPS